MSRRSLGPGHGLRGAPLGWRSLRHRLGDVCLGGERFSQVSLVHGVSSGPFSRKFKKVYGTQTFLGPFLSTEAELYNVEPTSILLFGAPHGRAVQKVWEAVGMSQSMASLLCSSLAKTTPVPNLAIVLQ